MGDKQAICIEDKDWIGIPCGKSEIPYMNQDSQCICNKGKSLS